MKEQFKALREPNRQKRVEKRALHVAATEVLDDMRAQHNQHQKVLSHTSRGAHTCTGGVGG